MNMLFKVFITCYVSQENPKENFIVDSSASIIACYRNFKIIKLKI